MEERRAARGRHCCRCGVDIAWGEGYYGFEEEDICADCMVDYVVERYYTYG